MITERPSTGLERPLPANFLHGVTPRSSRLLIGAQIVQQHTTAIQSTAALHDCAGVEAAQVASCGLLCLSGASFRPTASGPASGSTRAPAAPPTGPLRNLLSVQRRSQSHHDPGHLSPPRNLSRLGIGDGPAYGKHQMRRIRVTAAAGPAIPRALQCRWPAQGRLALDIPYCAAETTQQTSCWEAL